MQLTRLITAHVDDDAATITFADEHDTTHDLAIPAEHAMHVLLASFDLVARQDPQPEVVLELGTCRLMPDHHGLVLRDRSGLEITLILGEREALVLGALVASLAGSQPGGSGSVH